MAQRNPETEIGGGPGAFQSTLWSVVLRAKDPASPERRQALETLIRMYWKPLYYFVRRRGHSPETSKDLTQGFFAELLARDSLRHFDPDLGKFRTYLLAGLKHYLADQLDHDRAQKRGGGRLIMSLDYEEAENEAPQPAGSSKAPDDDFKRDWAVHVMAQAMDAVRASYQAEGRTAEFDGFKAHLTSLHPPGASYESLAAALGVSVSVVRNRIRAARSRYREAILNVIRSYTESSEEARQELKDLLSAFS